MEEKIIISLGGSLVVPEEIDAEFLHSFRDLILEEVAQGKKFSIIVGGGKLARKYQKVATDLVKASNEDLDWLGIKALNLNAELVRVIFGKTEGISIHGAEKPGNSTDLGAVKLAKANGAKKVINLSNTDYVYDSDPKQNPNAKKFEEISWSEYRKLIPEEWSPGLNAPFDPIASKAAEEDNIEVVIMNGKPVENLKKYLNGEKFSGTKIK